jgi:1-acyl-sn-glycerol-3-phosphate acyltransferase
MACTRARRIILWHGDDRNTFLFQREMIRAAFVALAISVVAIVVGLPLLIYVLLTGKVDPLYRTGVGAVIRIARIAGLRTRVEGLENIPQGTCLFAANHTSNADAAAIVGSIPRRIAILAKKSLFAIPIVGTAFRLAQFVPVDRAHPERAAASIDVAAERMKRGVSFLIYPEGTRSPDGRLLPFRRGAFVLAIKAGVPVVPVACSGAHRVIPKKSYRITPGDVVVRFCPAVNAAEYSLDRRNELAGRVHAVIAAALPPDQQPATAATRPSSSGREEDRGPKMEKVLSCRACGKAFKVTNDPTKPFPTQHKVEQNATCPLCGGTNTILWPQASFLLVLPVDKESSRG